MARQANVSVSGGSLPTGVTQVQSGSGSASVVSSGGRNVLRANHTGTDFAYARVALGTVSGTTAGTFRGLGGAFRINTLTTASGAAFRIWRAQGNSNAQFLCQLVYQNLGAGAGWGWYITARNIPPSAAETNTNYPLPAPYFTNLHDGDWHKFYCAYGCSNSDFGGTFFVWIDDERVLELRIDNDTVTYGTGVSDFWLGNPSGTAATSYQIDYWGLYVADSSLDNDPAGHEGEITLTQPTAADRTVTLTSPNASPVWESLEPEVATVSSGGVATLQQVQGGLPRIADGLGSVKRVVFPPRVITWSAGGYSLSGSSITLPITAASGDGHTGYADLFPGVLGGDNLHPRPTAASGSAGSYTVGLATTDSGAGGPYTAFLNGDEATLAEGDPSSRQNRVTVAMGIGI